MERLGINRYWQYAEEVLPGPECEELRQLKVDLFDFDLPEDRVALTAIEPRDAARMLVVRPGQSFEDRIVRDLPGLLRSGDVLVMNDTRVIPAALEGRRVRDGQIAKVAFNLTKRLDDKTWRSFARPAKRLRTDDTIEFTGASGMSYSASVSAIGAAGEVELKFAGDQPVEVVLEDIGTTPLPPYISLKRKVVSVDAERYQTVFAREAGAVAAPTAGLHMTEGLLAELAARGIEQHYVTLHVGAGTFLPVKTDDTADHLMHAEWLEVSAATAAAISEAKTSGRRIVALGTTALRALESATAVDGTVQPMVGETAIFITPGYRFRCVDVLVTNFHLPRSTLFMLVSAFAGLDVMKRAYGHAIEAGYRFYSYGDASLLFRAEA